jgi:hypothetical protein
VPKLFHCSQVEGKNAGNPERTLTIVNESNSSAQRIDDALAALREGEPQGTVPVIADDDFHDLYKRIDRAMYRSKHLGGDRVTVYSDAHRTEISAPESGHYFSLQERSAYESSKFPLLMSRRSPAGRTRRAGCSHRPSSCPCSKTVISSGSSTGTFCVKLAPSKERANAAASPTCPVR